MADVVTGSAGLSDGMLTGAFSATVLSRGETFVGWRLFEHKVTMAE